jgi:hypothetical protein
VPCLAARSPPPHPSGSSSAGCVRAWADPCRCSFVIGAASGGERGAVVVAAASLRTPRHQPPRRLVSFRLTLDAIRTRRVKLTQYWCDRASGESRRNLPLAASPRPHRGATTRHGATTRRDDATRRRRRSRRSATSAATRCGPRSTRSGAGARPPLSSRAREERASTRARVRAREKERRSARAVSERANGVRSEPTARVIDPSVRGRTHAEGAQCSAVCARRILFAGAVSTHARAALPSP